MSDLSAISGARIFDGHRWHDDAALLVEFGHVSGIIDGDAVPAALPWVEGEATGDGVGVAQAASRAAGPAAPNCSARRREIGRDSGRIGPVMNAPASGTTTRSDRRWPTS